MRIPSATIEIGPMNAVPSSCRDAVLTSIFNVLHWSKMLDSPPQQITQVPVLQLKEPHRYIEYPQMPHTGIVDWEKNASEQFKKGDVIAYVRSMDGTLRSKIIAEMDGYVIGTSAAPLITHLLQVGIMELHVMKVLFLEWLQSLMVIHQKWRLGHP